MSPWKVNSPTKAGVASPFPLQVVGTPPSQPGGLRSVWREVCALICVDTFMDVDLTAVLVRVLAYCGYTETRQSCEATKSSTGRRMISHGCDVSDISIYIQYWSVYRGGLAL